MKPPLFTIDGRQVSYLPMQELLESMRQTLSMPYRSIFSFLPLIHKMNERVSSAECEMTAAMIPQVKDLEEKLSESQGRMDGELREAVDGLTKMLLPSMYFEGEYGFICPPFIKEFIYATPSMQELYDKEQWLVKVNDDFLRRKEYGNVQQAAAVILNRFYGQQIDLSFRDNLTFRHVKTGREMHLRLDTREDYIDIEPVGELREINEEQMHYLLNNFKDDQVVLDFLPADKFVLKGMGIGIFTDVTDLEIQSLIKDSVLNVGNIKAGDFLGFLEQQMNDYLKRQDVRCGFSELMFEDISDGITTSLSGRKDYRLFTNAQFEQASCHPYHEAYCTKESIVIPDLDAVEFKSPFEQGLIDNGFRSAILIPLTDSAGKVTSITEICSTEQYAFNTTIFKKLTPIIELLALGNEVFLSGFNNKVESYIKSKFTAIHPSVQWKFEDIAVRQQIEQEKNGSYTDLEPIVFKDVYPLYGQIDIRNSSNIRNNAIQEDLINNLEMAIEIIHAYMDFVDIHLLDAYMLKATKTLRLLKDGYTSSLESATVDLLNEEIHPFLVQLSEQFPEIPAELLEDYNSSLDKDLGIVNKNRKAYEKSVNKLNKTLSNFLEIEDEKMQQNLPHYFEKYKTDGVEHNIYIGQSMLKNEQFSKFHLKDFRLWQMVKMVEMTNLVSDLKPKLKIPLETSQLVFVYNSAISIRFRMDEKRFDVDGTYNVRYEILKKRIDKAVIKGSGERLSQSGKIAIVYLLDKDKEEYMGYLEYLIGKGMIEEKIEDLELERLQGAEGLRSLRVSVIQ